VQLSFFGATGTVTGSKYLVEAGGRRILVDCGLFQGYKQLRLRNWKAPPAAPSSIDAVVLTHAHIDHSGYLPRLVKGGFDGPVYTTEATRDLCAILLPDSGFLQEREAEFANQNAYSKHRPALPLYTQAEAEAAMALFRPVPFGDRTDLGGGVTAAFHHAGHILGASMIELRDGETTLLFSGDLGRRGMPTMPDPETGFDADYVVVESTYGNRLHGDADPADLLQEIVTTTVARGGTLLIPAFAVGRTQTILYYLELLRRERRIPDVPIYVDSPMAINATAIFTAHPDDHRLTERDCRRINDAATYVRDADASQALDRDESAKILISASGMVTGGRILHHMKHYAPDSRTTILFTGFLAGGTRGAAMMAGAETVKIHGGHVPIHAEIRMLDMLSAHADAAGVIDWLRGLARPPRHVFVTHGEPDSSDRMRVRIQEELGWDCSVPDYLDRVDL